MRLIDAESTKKLAQEHLIDPYHIVSACAVIDKAETVDAVPVVRCRECKHFNLQTHECENELLSTDHEGGASYSLNFYDDDFCSCGEKAN